LLGQGQYRCGKALDRRLNAFETPVAVEAVLRAHFLSSYTSRRCGARYNRNTSVRITISKENYLKAIAEAESEGESVKAVTLSRWLDVSAPAVTMAIKRLKRDDLIRVGREAQITLTDTGWEIANRLLHRHHLIERMLAEIFGLEWYKVHDEAEALEHAVSADFERKLAEKLGNSRVCPHGNLVVDSPRERRRRGLKPLEEAQGRERVSVASVFERDRALLEDLDRKGIRPGVTLEVLAVSDEVSVQAGHRTVRLDRAAAAKVWVGKA
jgi:DtxR family Mn-dependent transcriptional regulator